MDRVSEVLLTMLSIEVLQLLITGVGVEKLDSSRKEPKFWGSKMS